MFVAAASGTHATYVYGWSLGTRWVPGPFRATGSDWLVERRDEGRRITNRPPRCAGASTKLPCEDAF